MNKAAFLVRSNCEISLPLQMSPQLPLIARFMVPTWGPSGADRAQVGPMLAPWTLPSGPINNNWLQDIDSRLTALHPLIFRQQIDVSCIICSQFTLWYPKYCWHKAYSLSYIFYLIQICIDIGVDITENTISFPSTSTVWEALRFEVNYFYMSI